MPFVVFQGVKTAKIMKNCQKTVFSALRHISIYRALDLMFYILLTSYYQWNRFC